jgi:hypothetical protein
MVCRSLNEYNVAALFHFYLRHPSNFFLVGLQHQLPSLALSNCSDSSVSFQVYLHLGLITSIKLTSQTAEKPEELPATNSVAESWPSLIPEDTDLFAILICSVSLKIRTEAALTRKSSQHQAKHQVRPFVDLHTISNLRRFPSNKRYQG